jgi:hypothetical protein
MLSLPVVCRALFVSTSRLSGFVVAVPRKRLLGLSKCCDSLHCCNAALQIFGNLMRLDLGVLFSCPEIWTPVST